MVLVVITFTLFYKMHDSNFVEVTSDYKQVWSCIWIWQNWYGSLCDD